MPRPPRLSIRPPSARRYRPGDTIRDKYQLESLLGEGGMGEVWAARNLTLHAECAIKLVRAELKDPTARARLFAEARASAQLTHPAIVRVFDVDETSGGEPFVVMELLRGESLAHALKERGRIDPVQCVQLLLPIVDALCFAHKRGVVHRDLKPDNVFLSAAPDRELQPKLVDFGLVKVEQVELESKLTQAGTIVGSPEYLSPEQARGRSDVDHRTDIWSFSVLMFEALSAQMPFRGDNYNALLMAIVGEEPRTLESLAPIDRDLATIVRVGLLKDRDQRWQSMSEVGRALAEWLLARNVTHDVTGASIEARWLGDGERTTLIRFAPGRGARAGQGVTVSGERAWVPSTGSGAVLATEPRRPQNKALVMGASALLVAAVAGLWLASPTDADSSKAPTVASVAGPTALTVAAALAPPRQAVAATPSTISPEPPPSGPDVRAAEPMQARPAEATRAPSRSTEGATAPPRANKSKPRPAAKPPSGGKKTTGGSALDLKSPY